MMSFFQKIYQLVILGVIIALNAYAFDEIDSLDTATIIVWVLVAVGLVSCFIDSLRGKATVACSILLPVMMLLSGFSILESIKRSLITGDMNIDYAVLLSGVGFFILTLFPCLTLKHYKSKAFMVIGVIALLLFAIGVRQKVMQWY